MPDFPLKDWREHPEVLTDSLWQFPRNSHEGNDFHGKFVGQVAYQLVRRYSVPGELVLDAFLGSGTTVTEALSLGRRVAGIDIASDAIDASEARTEALGARGEDYTFIQADSSTWEPYKLILERMGEASLVILHPPYHDIIRFSDHPRDLSNAPDLESFLESFRNVVHYSTSILRRGGHVGIVIGDKYAKGEVIPLGFECLDVARQEGLVLKALNVKDIQGNEKGKGKDANLWRYRALAGGFSIFTHEYVLVLRKP